MEQHEGERERFDRTWEDCAPRALPADPVHHPPIRGSPVTTTVRVVRGTHSDTLPIAPGTCTTTVTESH